MKISFLLHNAYSIGGTIRSTLNLAGALAARHDVEVVSVFRTSDKPTLGISGKVRLTPLVDERPEAETYDGDNPLMAQPSAVVPSDEVLVQRYTALSDARLRAHLQRTDADVVIATRPALVVFLALHGSGRYVRIGQEHLSYENHTPGVRIAQNEAIGKLDAFVTVSARDAEHHRAELPGAAARITDIPNAVPRPRAELSDHRAPLVVAAGRLARVKRYDLLVEAFAKVVEVRPEWGLRIYGKGPQKPHLQADIDRLGLNDHVRLMGPHATMETEWAKGSVAAVTSDWESFGMTILEAMHAGVPVVATDCPHGPGEIITDGTDGLLVPPGDAGAIAAGLLKLMDNVDERHRLGEAARVTAQKFAPRKIAMQYEQLIDELREERAGAMTKFGRRMRRAVRGMLPDAKASTREAPAREAPARETVAQEPAEPASARTAPRVLRPRADCRVDSAGDVLVSVAAAGVSGKDLSLVVRLRKSEEEFRAPLAPPADAKAPWTATLSRHTVPEGRWDLYVERAGDGMRRRVRARLVEQRALLTVAPAPEAWWIPYTTKDGYLALRTFRRQAHAEVTSVRAADGSVTVEGALYGVSLGAGAVLAGVARGEDLADFEVDAERTAGGFRATVTAVPDSPALVSGTSDKREWDLFLRPAEGAEPVRVGRVSGDIVDRKGTDKYPAVALTGGEVRPFFTVTNDLAFSAN